MAGIDGEVGAVDLRVVRRLGVHPGIGRSLIHQALATFVLRHLGGGVDHVEVHRPLGGIQGHTLDGIDRGRDQVHIAGGGRNVDVAA